MIAKKKLKVAVVRRFELHRLPFAYVERTDNVPIIQVAAAKDWINGMALNRLPDFRSIGQRGVAAEHGKDWLRYANKIIQEEEHRNGHEANPYDGWSLVFKKSDFRAE
jgi:hypothetical protein